VVKDPAVLQLIYAEVHTQDSVPSNYLLGLERLPVDGVMAHGHGGFWRTAALYLPSLDAAVSISVTERDHRALKNQVLIPVVAMLVEERR